MRAVIITKVLSQQKSEILFFKDVLVSYMILRLTHHRWGPVIIYHLCVGRGGVGSEKDRMVFRGTEWDQS